MKSYKLTVNGQKLKVQAEPDTPILWVLRDYLNLKGTKFGCGMALCGACTIHLDGQPIRSCTTPISSVKNSQHITTIEGISPRWQPRRSKSMARRKCPAVRLLPIWSNNGRGCFVETLTKPDRRRNRDRHVRPYLPLRNVSAHQKSHSSCRRNGAVNWRSEFIPTTLSGSEFIPTTLSGSE